MIKSSLFSAVNKTAICTKDSAVNGWSFTSCLTQQMAVLVSALRGFQSIAAALLMNFAGPPARLYSLPSIHFAL